MQKVLINRPFHRARLNYLYDKLSKTPKCVLGIRKGKSVIREYQDNKLIHENFIDTPIGQERLNLMSTRAKLEALYDKYLQQWNSTYVDKFIYSSEVYISGKMDDSFWFDRLQCGSSTDNDSTYIHKGIKMRSRAEVLIADVLDSMDLEYIYEAPIKVGEKTYYSDFLVRVPEMNMCFIIEFFGMIDDTLYFSKMVEKFRNYSFCGFRNGKDIIYLMGDTKSMPSVEDIRSAINSVLDSYCMC